MTTLNMVRVKNPLRDVVFGRVPFWDEYWKLSEDYWPKTKSIQDKLRGANYHFKAFSKAPRLKELIWRSDQGPMSYERLKVGELRKFARDRKIILSTRTKDGVISALEAADDVAIFRHLFDLPPELRNRIYTLYHESLETLDYPRTPPLLRASRQLRQETLLLFYQSCTIFLVLSDDSHEKLCRMHASVEDALPNGDMSSTKTIFSRLPIDYLGNIRKLHLVAPVSTSKNRWVYGEWFVDLGVNGNATRISRAIARCNEVEFDPSFEDKSQKIELLLRAELKAIMDREGNNKLQRGDFDMLKRIFESTYHQA